MAKRVVLITGVTGVVGSTIAPLLLQEPETELRLIMRATSEQHLQERLHELFEFWKPEIDIKRNASRAKAVKGDVSAPYLGLNKHEYQSLSNEVTHIIHCAANVKMNMSVEEANKISIDSAKEIVALVEACQKNGQFLKLEYVSTLGIAGKMIGLIPETPLLDDREFHNTYESSKAKAETFILDKINDGLPATVHRPSMIIGNSHTGKTINFQIFYHLCEFISGVHTHGILPNFGAAQLDIIPADFVAKAIIASSQNRHYSGNIFNLCSGPKHSIKLAKLEDAVRQQFTKQGIKLPRPIHISPRLFTFFLSILSLFANRRNSRALKALSLLLGYLSEAKHQSFSNNQAIALLADAEVEFPATNIYLAVALNYYLEHKKSQARE